MLNNFDNIAVDEISAEEIPEPQSAESLEAAPEPGKYPQYVKTPVYSYRPHYIAHRLNSKTMNP